MVCDGAFIFDMCIPCVKTFLVPKPRSLAKFKKNMAISGHLCFMNTALYPQKTKFCHIVEKCIVQEP